MKAYYLLAITFLLISCAPKVERTCFVPELIKKRYTKSGELPQFRAFGRVKYGPLKLPFMLLKSEQGYTLKVAKVREVSLSEDRFCFKERCYLLPFPPEDLILGRILSGGERMFCEGGKLYLEKRGKTYVKTAVFEGSRFKEIIVYNPNKDKTLRVLLDEEDAEGFFKKIRLISEGEEIVFQIEEVKL